LSRQYPGAQPGPNATWDGVAGSAFTTSPVALFKQRPFISQYPAGQRELAGLWHWAVAETAQTAIAKLAKANRIDNLCMTVLRRK
jgi:hypothetical protein